VWAALLHSTLFLSAQQTLTKFIVPERRYKDLRRRYVETVGTAQAHGQV